MQAVRKVSSAAAAVALGVIGLVVVSALVGVVVRNPLRSALIGIGVVVVTTLLGGIINAIAPRVKKGTILELDLPDMPAEQGTETKLASLRPNKPLSLGGTIEAIERASRDKRVAGLILRPTFSFAPRASVDELRKALVDFGATGKFTIAIVDSFGEGGPANGAYTLATACKEVTMQESGYLGLSGLSVDQNFYPDVLSRLGIEMQIFGRGKYKSAPNRFKERKFTPADREQVQRLLDNFWAHTATQIAQSRGMTAEEVTAYADRGPLQAEEALTLGLVDRIAYPDQVLDDVKKNHGGDKAKLLYLNVYKKRAGKGRQSGKTTTVAVIRAAGEIQRDGMPPIGLGGVGNKLTPALLTTQIRAAVKDKSVKAIVLRIDSPGGSALASDSMWRELIKAKESGKPLVASMGGVAASGGYYIAAPADKIVALPTTVTGSIGVFGMMPVVAEAKAKLNIHTDEIYTGKEPPGTSINRKVSRTRKKRLDADIDATYQLFRQRVADGRKMAFDDVTKVAEGRVWTGADAVEAGLVDELGGLDHALAVAVRLSGAEGTRPKAKPFPKKANALGSLRKKKGENSEEGVAASASLFGLKSVEGLTGVVAHMGFDARQFWIR